MVDDASPVGDGPASANPQHDNPGSRRSSRKRAGSLNAALDDPAATPDSGDAPTHAHWCRHCSRHAHAQLIRLVVKNLPANNVLSLRLRPWFGKSFWALGGDESGVGFTIRADGDQPTIRVGQLRVTRSEIQFAPLANTPRLTIEAYAICHASIVGGEIGIPVSASAIIQSSFDSQSLIGTTSWYLRLI